MQEQPREARVIRDICHLNGPGIQVVVVVYTLSDGVVLFPKWVIPLAKDCHLPDHNASNTSNSAGLCYQVPPSCVDRRGSSTARRKLVFAGGLGWRGWLNARWLDTCIGTRAPETQIWSCSVDQCRKLTSKPGWGHNWMAAAIFMQRLLLSLSRSLVNLPSFIPLHSSNPPTSPG